METETSWTAVVALVIAILAIIFIIIIAFLIRSGNTTITNFLDTWSIRSSGTTGNAMTPEVFTASPNSILQVVSGIPATYHVAIAAYPDISSLVVAGRTTIFKIVNTTPGIPGQAVTVVGSGGVTIATTTPSGSTIATGTTGTYMWTSPTQVQRIS